MTSRNTPPTPSVSGLVSYLMRQAFPHPSSKNVSAGYWLGDLFKMYLRDTEAIQDKHLATLKLASSDIMALMRTPPDDVVRLTATMSNLNVPSDIVEDNQMGVYIDEMD
jgi:hypothetical protein